MAMARFSCASFEIDPYDIAPVEKRLTIASTGSTSSIGIGGRTPSLNVNKPRSVASWFACTSTIAVYCLKIS